jgi:NADH:ubiquinone oxidoreductase subunit 6 (subunit J)
MVEIVVVVGLKASGRLAEAPDVGAAFGSPSEIGRVFLSDHLLAFEITSIVLLAAAVGGVVLGSQAHEDQPKSPGSTALQGGARAK